MRCGSCEERIAECVTYTWRHRLSGGHGSRKGLGRTVLHPNSRCHKSNAAEFGSLFARLTLRTVGQERCFSPRFNQLFRWGIVPCAIFIGHNGPLRQLLSQIDHRYQKIGRKRSQSTKRPNEARHKNRPMFAALRVRKRIWTIERCVSNLGCVITTSDRLAQSFQSTKEARSPLLNCLSVTE
jgi:hypothetical protein